MDDSGRFESCYGSALGTAGAAPYQRVTATSAGSGIPIAGSVHEVAASAAADARVAYVDRDPIAVAEGRKLLTASDKAAVIQADVRDHTTILSDPVVGSLIDFGQPAAIMLVAVLHFVMDADNPQGIVGRLRAAAAPGSFLVISHVTSQGSETLAAAAERVYNSRAADGQARSREQIAEFFGGWELAEPGLVYAPLWRPDPAEDVPDHPERFWFLAGVAREPGPAWRGSPSNNCGTARGSARRSESMTDHLELHPLRHRLQAADGAPGPPPDRRARRGCRVDSATQPSRRLRATPSTSPLQPGLARCPAAIRPVDDEGKHSPHAWTP